MPQLGFGELMLLFLVVLLLFGASQIPKVARSLGQGIREFKKSARELAEDDTPSSPETPPRKEPPAS